MAAILSSLVCPYYLITRIHPTISIPTYQIWDFDLPPHLISSWSALAPEADAECRT